MPQPALQNESTSGKKGMFAPKTEGPRPPKRDGARSVGKGRFWLLLLKTGGKGLGDRDASGGRHRGISFSNRGGRLIQGTAKKGSLPVFGAI